MSHALLLLRQSVRFLLLAACCLVFLFAPCSSQAAVNKPRSSGPLQTRSQNPLSLTFLSQPLERAQTLPRNTFELQWNLQFSNVFEYDQVSNTTVNLDMEIWRTALQFGYGLTDHLDVKIELPFIANTSGFLDSFIQSYHNAFGLPNGGRELVPNGSFSYGVAQGGIPLINYQQSGFALSDLNFRFKYMLNDLANLPVNIAVVGALKLPTGRKSRGLGSGHVDAGLSVLVEKNWRRFHVVSQIGYVFTGSHDRLSSIQRIGFLSFGQSFEFQLLDGLSLIAQLHGNTSPFKNVDSSDLTRVTLDLDVGLGGRFDLKHKTFKEFYYQWAFSEDILASGPSVDFSLLFLTGLRF